MENIKDIEGRMQKSVDNLKEEYVTIRAGRANPHILDRLRVDYYGTPTPIQQVANVSVPEARMIQIQPWEASLIKEIQKAILSSDLGLNVPRPISSTTFTSFFNSRYFFDRCFICFFSNCKSGAKYSLTILKSIAMPRSW